MPSLTLLFKGKTVHEYSLLPGCSLTIGRKESNDVVIDNLGVSGFHARIDSVLSQFTLVDLGSTNGTFVNRELVTNRLLRDRDVLLIGKHELLFDCSDLTISEKNLQNDTDEETLHLDTAEYRELIKKAKREAENSS